jgi:hypothetical protein
MGMYHKRPQYDKNEISKDKIALRGQSWKNDL